MSSKKVRKAQRTCRLKRFFRKALYTAAVIVAGGSSTRFGGATPKQFLLLNGIPVVVHAMLAYEKSPLIDEIVVVCRTGEEGLYATFAEQYGITKFKKAVKGGETRQKSALLGVEATAAEARYVLIHDGARPLVSAEAIRDTVLATHDFRAACCAMPSHDTVKIVNEKGLITKTEDRSLVYLAATPQGFYKTLYVACAYEALKEDVAVTDDASLLEHYYYPVKIVPCNRDNIKVTTPSDLYMAQALLDKRADKACLEEEKR